MRAQVSAPAFISGSSAHSPQYSEPSPHRSSSKLIPQPSVELPSPQYKSSVLRAQSSELAHLCSVLGTHPSVLSRQSSEPSPQCSGLRAVHLTGITRQRSAAAVWGGGGGGGGGGRTGRVEPTKRHGSFTYILCGRVAFQAGLQPICARCAARCTVHTHSAQAVVHPARQSPV